MVNKSVVNAARIIRIGGTANRKGSSTSDRPHRLCHFQEMAEGELLEVVPCEPIEAVAALAIGAASNDNGQRSSNTNGKIDVELRELHFGKRGNVFRAIFTIDADTVRVLRIRRAGRRWLTRRQIEDASGE